MPEIPEMADARVSFLRCESPYPDNSIESERHDQRVKVNLLFKEAATYGASAIARIDADDRVSCNLVQYYLDNPHPTGYLFNSGYAWDYREKSLAPFDKIFSAPFYMRCGTAVIFSLKCFADGDETPDEIARYLTDFGKHTEYTRKAKEKGVSFGIIPFPAAVYVLNHGSGLAYRHGWRSEAKQKRHNRIIKHRMSVGPELREEFSLVEEFQPAPARLFAQVRTGFARKLLPFRRLSN